MTAAETAFPEFHPLVDLEMQVARRTKKVHVIGHDEVVTNQPCSRFCEPDVCQRVLYSRIGHPGYGILGVDCDEEDVRLPEENVRAGGWCLSADTAVDPFTFGHERSVARQFGGERRIRW